MNPKWFDLIGLIFALCGAITLACGLIIPQKRALQVGVSRMAEASDDKNICLPHVRDERRESRFALIGCVLLTIGFLLQIIGRLVG